MTIAQVLATKGGPVFTIRPEQTVRHAIAMFARHDIGALVVVDELGQVVGMLTERGVVRAALTDDWG